MPIYHSPVCDSRQLSWSPVRSAYTIPGILPAHPSELSFMTILVFGSINMDLTTYVPHLPSAGETLLGHSFITVPGGKGANQGVAATRMGAATQLVGRIGDDAFGREIALTLRAEGVDTAHMDIDTQHATGLAVINVDDAA